MVSAPNSPVHLLKIITDESDPKCIFIFQFQGDDAREQQSMYELLINCCFSLFCFDQTKVLLVLSFL
jgi:hypothetical protein